ncbi:MAG: CHAP domain-containing protein [bacterium]
MNRNIESKLVAYIDGKLAENGLAQEAIKNKDARLLLICAAHACVGIREKGGNNQGPLVELIQETVGGHSGERWCLSFVQTLIAYSEVKLGITSRFPVGEHCMTAWNQANDDLRVKFQPLPGAVIIWRHGTTSSGHTGIFLESDGGQMRCIEGNTESGVNGDGSIESDGGGVYLTKRSMKQDGNMRVVGFLKPF